MKSKLLLSLGLVAILGTVQASEETPEVRTIMDMFARLSPEQQSIVRDHVQQAPLSDRESGYELVENERLDLRLGAMSDDKLQSMVDSIAKGAFSEVKSLIVDLRGLVSEKLRRNYRWTHEKADDVLEAILKNKFANVRELCIKNPGMRLAQILDQVCSARTYGGGLWQLEQFVVKYDDAAELEDAAKIGVIGPRTDIDDLLEGDVRSQYQWIDCKKIFDEAGKVTGVSIKFH